MTEPLQFSAQLDKIIDLPVVGHPMPSLRIGHRLRSGLRHVDNGQAPVPQSDGVAVIVKPVIGR